MHILACEQQWVQLAAELGGDRVTAQNLLGKNRDPHHISPTPGALFLTRTADLLICNDIRDEPHLSALLARSHNPKVQPGRIGYIEASAYVPAPPTTASGHAVARRHVHNDPHNILLVAKVLSDRMAQLDQENAREYRVRYDEFSAKWNDAIRRWETKAVPLHNIAIVEQRESCAYLCRWLGIREVARLEWSGTGSIERAAMRTALDAFANNTVKMVVQGPYHTSAAVMWLQREKHLPVAIIRTIASDGTGVSGLYSMFDDAIAGMLAAASQG